MNNFLTDFLYFAKNYINKNYPETVIDIIDIDKALDFKYEENESPLHNSVIYLNRFFPSYCIISSSKIISPPNIINPPGSIISSFSNSSCS